MQIKIFEINLLAIIVFQRLDLSDCSNYISELKTQMFRHKKFLRKFRKVKNRRAALAERSPKKLRVTGGTKKVLEFLEVLKCEKISGRNSMSARKNCQYPHSNALIKYAKPIASKTSQKRTRLQGLT